MSALITFTFPADAQAVADLFDRAEKNALTVQEGEFVTDLRECWEIYGGKLQLSPRHLELLERILARPSSY